MNFGFLKLICSTKRSKQARHTLPGRRFSMAHAMMAFSRLQTSHRFMIPPARMRGSDLAGRQDRADGKRDLSFLRRRLAFAAPEEDSEDCYRKQKVSTVARRSGRAAFGKCGTGRK